jgi:hypothetical protein
VLMALVGYLLLEVPNKLKRAHIAFDPFKEVLYLEIVQWFKLFILPESFQAAPARHGYFFSIINSPIDIWTVSRLG